MKTRKDLYADAVICLLLLILTAENSYSQLFTRIDTSIVCSVEGFTHVACWGDFNNDGFEDLVIINGSAAIGPHVQFLFINEGEWRFRRITDHPVFAEPSDYGSLGATWGDYDNDGHPDLFIAGFNNANNMLFRNNGDGTFTQITNGSIVKDGGDSSNSNWVDIDSDGYLDIYVTNRRSQKNFLYRNNGNGTFTKITSGPLPNHIITDLDLGSSWADYDNDGDPDLFDVGLGDGQRYLFENDGFGNFTLNKESGLTEENEKSWSWAPPSWGDYDNDGYSDVFFTNYAINSWASAKDFLFHNSGDDTFERKTDLAPVNYNSEHDGGYWADLDNDGYLDLIISTYYTNETKIYWNNGDGTFKAGSGLFSANYGGCISIADINKDGFLDMFVGRGFYGSYKNAIFANNGNTNNWVNIKLVGTVSNASAIGSKVSIKATIGGKEVWQVRETGLNQHSKNAHFGLGDATIIDSLMVQWPAGHDTVLINVDTNQFMTITELIPAGLLKASFTADTLSGKGDVTVKFTDISRYDPGKPVTSWSWDFNNDGTEDSDEQHPSHTFSWSNDSIYDVVLKVSNGTDSSVMIKKEFIQLSERESDTVSSLVTREINEGIMVYPNPMRETVTFSFNLQTAADIQLVLYDMTGRRMAEIFNGNRNAGPHTINWNRGNLAPGTYFYEMKIASFNQIQRYNGKLLIMD